jgi:hypothetical protein
LGEEVVLMLGETCYVPNEERRIHYSIYTNVVKMQLAWRGRSRDMVPYSEIEANEHGA